jgi:hypothetical protein
MRVPMTLRLVLAALGFVGIAQSAAAQQRPPVTEDPETIGAGRILIEAGVDHARSQQYVASGLEGNLWRIGTLGVSFGISSIAEFQVDGGLFNRLSITERGPGPLAALVTVTGDHTTDVEDIVVATKIRALSETYRRPAFALRFAAKLPNASNESGLGLDTTDVSMALLAAKTAQSIRVVGNIGVAVLADPTVGHRQNDVLTYGVSLARALTDQVEVVGEVNGRVSVREREAFPGTETKGILTVGARYTTGSFRVDGGVFVGLNALAPTAGFSGGFTYVFRAFEVP